MSLSSRRLTRSVPAVALAVAFSLALAAASLAQQPLPAAASCPGDYAIGPEDVLEIAVWNNPDITRTVPVRPDGKISLPLLNDVRAEGLTPMQLRETLTKSLAPYIPTPTVSVIVREVHSFKVTVVGEVKTPGRYELKSRSTVLDVLAMAGGPNDYASRGRILVLRQQGPTTQQIPFAFDKLAVKHGSASDGGGNGVAPNLCLQPGDIVLVP